MGVKLNMSSSLSFKAVIVLLATALVFVNGRKSPNCSTCKGIVDNFKKGLSDTKKSNYGGGNTKWEEKSLGSYAYSEVRLVEIMEKLCESVGSECHTVLEEHEDLIERYWFKEFAQKKDTDLHTYLCIDYMKACCPKNTYGKDCTPCRGGVDKPCTGNGKCKGEGTREGNGNCECDSGYQGDMCDSCKDGFYEHTKNETDTVCKVCHISCTDICSEEGPTGCEECKDGWLVDEEKGCVDINECDEDPCEDHQYCTNTQGSYSCFSCDDACASCKGPGPGKCNNCQEGYKMNEAKAKCIDVNECKENPDLCTAENEICLNVPGSHKCSCKNGFERQDDKCVPEPKDRPKMPSQEQIDLAAEQFKKQLPKQHELDWSKFKNTPSVKSHFLVVGLYGISCHVARSSWLAMAALSLLLLVHVAWFASNCK